MILEDRLAEETTRIVANAIKQHKKKHLDSPLYLSRNTVRKDIDLINSSEREINAYIEQHKARGRFYLVGVKNISPRRLVIPPILDFIYTMLFHRFLSSVGNFEIKKKIYRKLGMRIGKNVHIYEGVKFDVFFSKLIEIGDNTTIGGSAEFYNHSTVASKDYFGWGIVKIGKNCTIGNNSLIAGIRMGNNSILKPATVTAGYLFDIKENAVYGGNPPKKINGYAVNSKREK